MSFNEVVDNLTNYRIGNTSSPAKTENFKFVFAHSKFSCGPPSRFGSVTLGV